MSSIDNLCKMFKNVLSYNEMVKSFKFLKERTKMTDLIIPNTFIPGTKAKAQEVNENFTAVKNAVNNKADVNGDETQTFAVATATQDNHAVNKTLFNQLSESLQETCNLSLTNFCVHSGNVNSQGDADLMSYSSGVISFKVGGDDYPNMVISNIRGLVSTITSLPNLNVSATSFSAFTPSAMTSNSLPSGYSVSSSVDVTNAYKLFDGNTSTYFQTNDDAVEVIYEIPEKIIPNQVYVLSNIASNVSYPLLGFELYGFSDLLNSYEHIVTDLSNTNQLVNYEKTITLSTNQSSHLYKKFKIVFKTAHASSYPPLVHSFRITGLKPDDTGLSSLDNETQNIFVSSDGDVYRLSNSIFIQNKRPVMQKDDLWIKTHSFPLSIVKFDGEEDVEFSDVFIGSVNFVSGAYHSHYTNPYNQNGYNLNALTPQFVNNWKNMMPDYSRIVQWVWGQGYYAPSDGWVFALGQALANNSVPSLTINDNIFYVAQSGISGAGCSAGFMAPVSKDDYIIAGNGTGSFTQFYFIPCKGV